MKSEHEIVTLIRDDLYPQISEIEERCNVLFNDCYPPGRGPIGLQGYGEVAYSIQKLRSAANSLERIARDRGLL